MPTRERMTRMADGGIDSAYGHSMVAQAPDRRVVIRLRQELVRDRRLGIPWSDALFAEEVAYVLKTLSGPGRKRERQSWEIVLQSTREAWRRAYERDDDPCAVGLRLEHLLAA